MRENHEKTVVPDLSGTCAGFCAGFFVEKPNGIKHVPDVPDFGPTPFMRVHAHENEKTTAHISPPHGYIPRHIRHIRHIVVLYRKNVKKGGTVSGTNPKNPAHPAAGVNFPLNPPPQTIRCTADNAPQFQQMVKNDPQLLALVQSLQVQDLFPGLRAMSLTLSGPAEQRAMGVGAWAAAAPTAPATAAPNDPQEPTPC